MTWSRTKLAEAIIARRFNRQAFEDLEKALRYVQCPTCARMLERFMTTRELEGQAWPEETRWYDEHLIANHDCP